MAILLEFGVLIDQNTINPGKFDNFALEVGRHFLF